MSQRLMTLFLFCILSCGLSFAQQSHSTLVGSVTTGGDPLPGVTLVLEGPDMQGSRNAVSNADGSYRFVLVPSGRDYKLTATISGFNTSVQKNIALALGKTTRIKVKLAPSKVAEEMVVTSETPLIDTTSPQISVNFTEEFVKTLTNDRQMQMVMGMTPGALPI